MTLSLSYPYLRNDNEISLHYKIHFMTTQYFSVLSIYSLDQQRHIHDDIKPLFDDPILLKTKTSDTYYLQISLSVSKSSW